MASDPKLSDALSCRAVASGLSVAEIGSFTGLEAENIKQQVLKLLMDLYLEGLRNGRTTIFPYTSEEYNRMREQDKHTRYSRVLRDADGRVVGLATGHYFFRTEAVRYQKIGIAPEYRNRGLAKELICSIAARARERDKHKVELSVVRGETAANSLYAKFEFRPVEYQTVQLLPHVTGMVEETLEIQWMEASVEKILAKCKAGT